MLGLTNIYEEAQTHIWALTRCKVTGLVSSPLVPPHLRTLRFIDLAECLVQVQSIDNCTCNILPSYKHQPRCNANSSFYSGLMSFRGRGEKGALHIALLLSTWISHLCFYGAHKQCLLWTCSFLLIPVVVHWGTGPVRSALIEEPVCAFTGRQVRHIWGHRREPQHHRDPGHR